MAIRFAYDQNDTVYTTKQQRSVKDKVYKPQTVYKDIMTDLLKNYDSADFDLDGSDVVQRRYCTSSGLLAGAGCGSTKVGYYKKSNLPQTCNMSHYDNQKLELDED